MPPQYKLTYFDVQGVAETARYLFSYGGIEFEDVRVKREDWPQHKPKTPFGVVPTLQHNGKVAGQSIAIARYLAKKVKLAGNNDWEDLEIDATVDTLHDIKIKITPTVREQDAAKKKVLLETAKKDFLGFYLARLEALVEKNKGYLVLGRLTWADFYFTTIFTVLEFMSGEEFLAGYPNLKGVREKVNGLPAIKKWIEIRPN